MVVDGIYYTPRDADAQALSRTTCPMPESEFTELRDNQDCTSGVWSQRRPNEEGRNNVAGARTIGGNRLNKKEDGCPAATGQPTRGLLAFGAAHESQCRAIVALDQARQVDMTGHAVLNQKPPVHIGKVDLLRRAEDERGHRIMHRAACEG